ncbi:MULTISPECIES: alpha-ketoacid dehydrogenase subunit beta [unclassified Oleiphilus]|uniref:alpha-ketoacid dehydrogenase subunit beta n=1 Tax=unclassified Oleiphilus TaxID=2631174 RepID=UPI0007C3EBE8|nr:MULTISPECIES: transketolase C-terminal domain-containing protein [unclassified Oleiphilus]KZZ37456.1 acetoin dehydrogenase [Oleiphilus sp. HI0117]KZZ54150.1 acetoin dehydrogenase [Oleiphilus sp. HI0123]
MKNIKEITFGEAILESSDDAMSMDQSVIYYGLGINDPTCIFGTTKGLVSKHGNQRVFDTPTSENSMLGVGVGAAINGLRPIMVSQRLDFFLLAMDQLVNNAAKWHFMFGGQSKVPMVIRLIVGRGWGQGPTHSQSLQSWFAHIPGLKVVMPSTPDDAYRLMMASIFDDNPVVFIEHRWLHQQKGLVNMSKNIIEPLAGNTVVLSGDAITIVASSYLVIEAKIAISFLRKNYRIDCELIDLNIIAPMEVSAIQNSVKKTGRLLVLDNGHETCSIASEVVSRVVKSSFSDLKQAPEIMAKPDYAEPTSYALTKEYYIDAEAISLKVAQMLGVDVDSKCLKKSGHHDVPGDWFTGPF